MQDYYARLLPGNEYHIVSRATGYERLFREKNNYLFFLGRYKNYISPIADTFSHSLLPNHFHFLARIKEEKLIKEHFIKLKKGQTYSQEIASDFIMQQFSNLLNSYTKSFNKIYERKGSLFMDYLRRVEISSADQFMATAFYIHKNPVHHGCCKGIDQWEWSSYNSIITDAPTWLRRTEVLGRFGGLKNFLDYHSKPIDLRKSAVAGELYDNL